LHACSEYCAAQGYAIVETCRDEGFKGSDRSRPGYQQLLADARAQRLDVVVFYDTTRLARGLLNQLLFEDELRGTGIKIEFATFTVEDTPEGRLAQNVRGIIGEYEREKFRSRSMAGRLAKASAGKVTSARAPFGFTRDATEPSGLKIGEEAARWVRLIFRWVNEGVSLRRIRARLAAQGCPTPRGGPWAHSTLRKLVRCEHYIGRAWYNKRMGGKGSHTFRDATKWIPIAVPAIIDQATFDQAQVSLRQHVTHVGGRPGKFVYLVGGLAACGLCGRRLRGDVEHRKQPVYRCRGRDADDRRSRCYFRIAAAKVDAAMWAYVEDLVRDPRLVDSKAKQRRLGLDAAPWVTAQADLADLDRSCRRVAAKRTRLRELYVDGRIDRAAFDADDGPFAAEESRLQTERARVAAVVASERAAADQQAALLARLARDARTLDGLDDRGRQTFVRQMRPEVVVYRDHIDVAGVIDLGPLPIDSPGRQVRRARARAARPAASGCRTIAPRAEAPPRACSATTPAWPGRPP